MTAIVEGLTPLATGFCFGEGPRWFEGLLWFSDMLGEAVHTALTVAKPKTRYTVTPQPFQNFLMLILPKRIVDNMIARQLGLKREA